MGRSRFFIFYAIAELSVGIWIVNIEVERIAGCDSVVGCVENTRTLFSNFALRMQLF